MATATRLFNNLFFKSYRFRALAIAISVIVGTPIALDAQKKKAKKPNKHQIELWENVRTGMKNDDVIATQTACNNLIYDLGTKHRYDSLGEMAHRILSEIAMLENNYNKIYPQLVYYRNFPSDDSIMKSASRKMESRLTEAYKQSLEKWRPQLGLSGVWVSDLHTDGWPNNKVSGRASKNGSHMPFLMLSINAPDDTLKMAMLPSCLLADDLGAYNWKGHKKNLYSEPVPIAYNDTTGCYAGLICSQKIENPHTATADFLSSIGTQVAIQTSEAIASAATATQVATAGAVGLGLKLIFDIGSALAMGNGVENGLLSVELTPESADVMMARIIFASLNVDSSRQTDHKEEIYKCRLYRVLPHHEVLFTNPGNAMITTDWFYVSPINDSRYLRYLENIYAASYPTINAKGKEEYADNESSMISVLSDYWKQHLHPDDPLFELMPPLYEMKSFNSMNDDNEISTTIGDYDKKTKSFKTFMASLDYDGQLIVSQMNNGVKDGFETVYYPSGQVVINEYRNGFVKSTFELEKGN